MSLIKYTDKDLDLLARLMRAEAVGEGELGMLMVGNVIVNRIISNCLTFKNIKTVNDAVFQNPGGFGGVTSELFYRQASNAEKELARRVLEGEYYYPATNSLWFYAPSNNEDCISSWYNQEKAGRYKHHCFYKPDPGICPELY